jgi:hypothetical protein
VSKDLEEENEKKFANVKLPEELLALRKKAMEGEKKKDSEEDNKDDNKKSSEDNKTKKQNKKEDKNSDKDEESDMKDQDQNKEKDDKKDEPKKEDAGSMKKKLDGLLDEAEECIKKDRKKANEIYQKAKKAYSAYSALKPGKDLKKSYDRLMMIYKTLAKK